MVRPSEARRALVLHDRQLVVDLIELTLNHGVFEVRAAADTLTRKVTPALGLTRRGDLKARLLLDRERDSPRLRRVSGRRGDRQARRLVNGSRSQAPRSWVSG
jgi:hypothetical protein